MDTYVRVNRVNIGFKEYNKVEIIDFWNINLVSHNFVD